MSDTILQRIWSAREAISRRCDFDVVKLVKFYQRMALQQKRVQQSNSYQHIGDADGKAVSVVKED